MFSQNGLYSQKTPQEQMMQQRQEAFFGTATPQNQNGAQMMPPQPQQPQMGMGMNPFGNAAGSYFIIITHYITFYSMHTFVKGNFQALTFQIGILFS